jgi:hypothetical protein
VVDRANDRDAMLAQPAIRIPNGVEIICEECDMRDTRVILARRFGAVVGFEDGNIVVIVIEAIEETLSRDFSSELHSEDFAIEASRRVKVADPDSHMAGTLYSHSFSPLTALRCRAQFFTFH